MEPNIDVDFEIKNLRSEERESLGLAKAAR
jgi:hypothetical protein